LLPQFGQYDIKLITLYFSFNRSKYIKHSLLTNRKKNKS
jgi:hypothetical protein